MPTNNLTNLSPNDLSLITGFNRDESYMEEWEEPVWYEQNELPEFNASIFPKWLMDFVIAVAESTQTAVDMACMAAITVLSIASAKNFVINPYGDWFEPLNTYCITLLGPANRKSSVHREMCLPMVSFEKEENERLKLESMKNESTRRTLHKRIEHLEGNYARDGDSSIFEEITQIQQELDGLPELSPPTFITDDATPEILVTLMKQNRERIGLVSAEAGLFDMVKGLYSGKINLEVYLKGHSGDYLRVDRRTRTEIVESPCITIGIFGQPDTVKNLPPIFQGRGFMARFLYSLPKDLKGYRKVRPESIPEDVRATYNKNIKLLMKQSMKKPLVLTFDAEADPLFADYQERIENELRDGGSLSNIPEWGGKIVGNIARIAGLLHIANQLDIDDSLECIPEKISSVTVYKAILLSNYFIQHAQAAFGTMKNDNQNNDASYLLKVLIRRYRKLYEEIGHYDCLIPFRDVQQLVKKRFNTEELNTVINELVERGFIKRALLASKNGDRQKKFIQINPYFLKQIPITPIPE
ncbi:YfjI family protein [Neobacillus sp. PS2-9]|uniref:YfjI family protein n=1 Tax=Neobacillus sp. PS2-9 TaxID=3070676 RepID=UPI0027DF4136|nr:YfjI family protein [Neobacillus sp. PS2-9]WML56672.1 YfjI family protein [Neobacillus sp. PS2-9]